MSIGYAHLQSYEGNATYRNLDHYVIVNMDAETLERRQTMNCTKEELLLYAVTDRSWLHGRTLKEQVKRSLRWRCDVFNSYAKNR